MNIGVFVKQVPIEGSVSTRADFTLAREGMARGINPADLTAVEEALRLKDSTGATVTVCSMGPASAESMLRQLAAMGADRLCLLCDPAFAGADTYATAKTLARAVQTLGGFDLLLCGRRTIDGETGQVGPELAALLGIPCAPSCVGLELHEDGLRCRSMFENEYQTWQFPLPALASVYYGINSPRLPSILGLRRAKTLAIEVLTAVHLGLDPAACGLKGSPTRVVNVQVKPFGKRPAQRCTAAEGVSTILAWVAQCQDVHNA